VLQRSPATSPQRSPELPHERRRLRLSLVNPVVNRLPPAGTRPARRNGTTGASRRQVAESARQNFWRFRDRGGSPCGRTGQKFWFGPKGLPSPELDPAQPRWEALIIERRSGVVRMERGELSSFVIAVHEFVVGN
jgi:hypothetical protein